MAVFDRKIGGFEDPDSILVLCRSFLLDFAQISSKSSHFFTFTIPKSHPGIDFHPKKRVKIT
jgi:hypothetical protein